MALYCHLISKQTNTTYTLRIEDTDQAREVEGAVDYIVHTLAWAGILPTEGVTLDSASKVVQIGDKGPYIQSERKDIYKKYAQELLEKGHAYHCFCTPERLDEMRKEQEAKKLAPRYDRACLKLSQDEQDKLIASGVIPVIRMKMPETGTLKYTDVVRGEVSFDLSLVDDQVLMKSDGFPTYHLAVVVDDHLMEIDLVLRGEEWLPSTPKHLQLYEFFGWAPPKFAHLPLLLNADKTKLSKRKGDVSVGSYREKGYLPQALLNFILLQGWAPSNNQEIFDADEMITAFDIDRVNKSGAVVDMDKLNWMNAQWMRKLPLSKVVDEVIAYEVTRGNMKITADNMYELSGIDTQLSEPEIEMFVSIIKDKMTVLHEWLTTLLIYKLPIAARDNALYENEKMKTNTESAKTTLTQLVEVMQSIPKENWNLAGITVAVKEYIDTNELKNGFVLWPLRVALTNSPSSPGAFESAWVLGKDEAVRRIAEAIEAL